MATDGRVAGSMQGTGGPHGSSEGPSPSGRVSIGTPAKHGRGGVSISTTGKGWEGITAELDNADDGGSRVRMLLEFDESVDADAGVLSTEAALLHDHSREKMVLPIAIVGEQSTSC